LFFVLCEYALCQAIDSDLQPLGLRIGLKQYDERRGGYMTKERGDIRRKKGGIYDERRGEDI